MNHPPPRHREAIHEAGHAVVARRLGLSCGGAIERVARVLIDKPA